MAPNCALWAASVATRSRPVAMTRLKPPAVRQDSRSEAYSALGWACREPRA